MALTIARIEHEHAERQALEEQRQGLLKKKQGLIADNKKRKDDLANLDKDLEKFIDVSLNSQGLMVKSLSNIDNRPPNLFRRPLRKMSELLAIYSRYEFSAEYQHRQIIGYKTVYGV